MTVYVDHAMHKFRSMIMCHMIADSIDELHSMADKIGVARKWFQNKRIPHYDICQSKRALAVKLGAKESDRTEFVSVMRRIQTQPLLPGFGKVS